MTKVAARPLRGRAALFALDAATAAQHDSGVVRHMAGTRRMALWLLPSHSARSRGIQELRA